MGTPAVRLAKTLGLWERGNLGWGYVARWVKLKQLGGWVLGHHRKATNPVHRTRCQTTWTGGGGGTKQGQLGDKNVR